MESKLNRLEFSQTFTRSYDYGDGRLVPLLGLSGIFDTSDSTNLTDSFLDVKTGIDASLLYTGDSGIDWTTSISYEGLGTDNNTLGLNLGLSINY